VAAVVVAPVAAAVADESAAGGACRRVDPPRLAAAERGLRRAPVQPLRAPRPALDQVQARLHVRPPARGREPVHNLAQAQSRALEAALAAVPAPAI